MVTSFDPKKVNVNIGGTILTGFASDQMITAAKSGDAVTPNVGVQGDVVYEENADESGTIAVVLQGTSPSVAYLRSLAANRKEFAVSISDANDDSEIHISATRCRVTKEPDVSRGKSVGSVTVNIFVPVLTIR